MGYIKYFENFKKYNSLALKIANKYYKNETGKNGYGDYQEILDRLNDFCNMNFPEGLHNIPENIRLFRLLNVENENEINKEKLGYSFVAEKLWFEDYDFLDSILYRYGEKIKRWFIVEIETNKNNLDIVGTLCNRAEYPDEYEFKILNDNNLKIINIEEVEPIKPVN